MSPCWQKKSTDTQTFEMFIWSNDKIEIHWPILHRSTSSTPLLEMFFKCKICFLSLMGEKVEVWH